MYTEYWEVAKNSDTSAGGYIVQPRADLVDRIGGIRQLDIFESEYAQVGYAALTASGIYGACSLAFPISGTILHIDSRTGAFTIEAADPAFVESLPIEPPESYI